MTEMAGRKLFLGHTYASVKMPWIRYQISRKDGFLNYPPPFLPSPPSPYVANSTSHKDSAKINPAVLFIIVILAVLFFISGILHLLVRFLTKKPSSARSNLNLEASSSDVLQRQLQQLFNLHDSGLDQAFIDSLPLFSYKEIVGPKKEPFDCAVCLCEFSETDQLRLLPTCSHAFHIDCIDTWLLSNSTCPLCRGALFNPGFPIENPIYDYDDFREEDGFGGNGVSSVQKRVRIEEVATEKGVFPVRLGKFRKLSNAEGEEMSGETSSSTLDARRCYSMGSYQYVVGDAKLRVALSRDRALCDGKLVEGKEQACNGSADDSPEGKKISIGTKTDSYSVSKIWLWSKKGKFASSSGAPLENPTSPNLDLSWMHKENGI